MVSEVIKSSALITTQICDRFKEEIRTGKYSVNDRLPSFGALAEAYGISKSTVHEAFKRLADEGYLFAKHGKGTFVNPERVERRRGALLKDVAILAFNLFSANDNTMIPLLESANLYAEKKKIRLHHLFIRGMSILHPDNAHVKEAIAKAQFDGLIIASPIDVKDIKWLRTLRLPFVAATSRYELKIPQVQLHNSRAAELCCDRFRKQGVTQAAIFLGPQDWKRDKVVPYAQELQDAFKKEEGKGGITYHYVSCGYDYHDAQKKGLALFSGSHHFDGAFFQADIIAKGALSAIKSSSIDVQKMTLVNYCDLEDYLTPFNIRKPLSELGVQSFKLLEQALTGASLGSLVLHPEIIQKP